MLQHPVVLYSNNYFEHNTTGQESFRGQQLTDFFVLQEIYSFFVNSFELSYDNWCTLTSIPGKLDSLNAQTYKRRLLSFRDKRYTVIASYHTLCGS